MRETSPDAAQGGKVITGEIFRTRQGRRKGFSSAPSPEPERRPARVANTLALAHGIQQAIDRGELRDQAEAARRLGVTRARLTQILNLTYLAPSIQEEILFLKAVAGAEPLRERALRALVKIAEWRPQRSHALLRRLALSLKAATSRTPDLAAASGRGGASRSAPRFMNRSRPQPSRSRLETGCDPLARLGKKI